MIRYPHFAQHTASRSLRTGIVIGVVCLALATSGFAQLPDFQVDANSITFSNPTPVEGEEITISVAVTNVGNTAQTMNQDLAVDFYEADPATKPLQIRCTDVILELEPGKTKQVRAQWRPSAGRTEIHAAVNPSGKKHIQEADTSNNIASAAIQATPVTFPPVTPTQIENAVSKGVAWIAAQQGRHSRTCLQCGTENQLILVCITCGANLKGLAENLIPGNAWHFGEDPTHETALSLQALLAAGLTATDEPVKKGMEFLMTRDWNEFAVYQLAVILPVLAELNDDAYRERAQFAVNQLVKKQLPIKGSAYADERDDGGWGYGYTADGAHMNMVIYALYAAKQWGLDVPEDTWNRSEKWIRRNQTETGGWLYNLVEDGSLWGVGPYGSMTATGLWALRACGVSVEDPQIQAGMQWLKDHWSLTRNPGSVSWLYYYLLSLQRFCDIPPTVDTLAGYDWYDEISRMMVANQDPDGRWRGESDFFGTCFAVMFLNRALIKPIAPNIGVVPQSLRFSPPTPRVGEVVRLSATLQNTGTPLDDIIKVGFYVDNHRVSETEVLWTPGLSETTISADWAPAVDGKQILMVRIEEDDLNSSDNRVTEMITVFPQSTAAADVQSVKPQKIGETVYQLGTVVFDTETRAVTVPGEINIVSDTAIIEFFACGKLGKTHESVLIVDAEPIFILTALGALDFKPGMNLTAEGDPRTPTGTPVDISVEWQQGDETISRSARELLWNTFTAEPMQKTSWIFTGGRVKNDQFTAQLFHNIIAVYRDPDSIFNHPLPTGTDDRTYRVNTDVIPPKGTKVKLVIRPITA